MLNYDIPLGKMLKDISSTLSFSIVMILNVGDQLIVELMGNADRL